MDDCGEETDHDQLVTTTRFRKSGGRVREQLLLHIFTDRETISQRSLWSSEPQGPSEARLNPMGAQSRFVYSRPHVITGIGHRDLLADTSHFIHSSRTMINVVVWIFELECQRGAHQCVS